MRSRGLARVGQNLPTRLETAAAAAAAADRTTAVVAATTTTGGPAAARGRATRRDAMRCDAMLAPVAS